MANFSITVTNGIGIVGLSETIKWGTMVWSNKWASGSQVITRVMKRIDNSQGFTWDFTGAGVRRQISQSIVIAMDMGSEKLTDGTGVWAYVFPSVTTEGEQRDFPSWAAQTATSVSFMCNAVSATSWSED